MKFYLSKEFSYYLVQHCVFVHNKLNSEDGRNLGGYENVFAGKKWQWHQIVWDAIICCENTEYTELVAI